MKMMLDGHSRTCNGCQEDKYILTKRSEKLFIESEVCDKDAAYLLMVDIKDTKAVRIYPEIKWLPILIILLDCLETVHCVCVYAYRVIIASIAF